jgi:anti-anti-sigma factor
MKSPLKARIQNEASNLIRPTIGGKMESMSLSLHSFPGQQLVIEFVLSGDLDAATLIRLERGFRERLTCSKYKWIVDLGGLEYISSPCLESFVSLAAELRLRGGDPHFVEVPPKIQKIFATLGFNLLFRILPDALGALDSAPASEALRSGFPG